jgi:hypothetical protein
MVDESKTNYHQISKSFWHFLHSLYGGGPVIVMKEQFYQLEVKKRDKAITASYFYKD